MAYDVIIKSGLVFDGIGDTPVVADIGVKGDKISLIGDLQNTSAPVVIQAEGKYVAPGFIDVTNHSDTHLSLFTYPNLESLLMQGITTIMGGNCGASLAPLASPEAIGAIRKWADPSGFNINWSDMDSFLQEVERLKPALNFGTFAGYGTLRRGVIKDEVRLLSAEEREEMRYLLREAIRQGAFGLSLGLAYGHERVSTTEEIIDIARVLSESGRVLKIHLRSEGGGILPSVNEVVRIARESGVSIQISHFKTIGRKAWHMQASALALIEQARASGLDISFDVSPYRTTGSPLYLLIPEWAHQGGFSELFSKIDNPTERAKIVEAMKKATFHYGRFLITSAKIKTVVGRTLLEVAEMSGLSPEEALLETVRANEGRVSIVGKTVLLKNMARAMESPDAFVASDGIGYSQDASKNGNLAHPRCFGAFPHFWHSFVTDTKLLEPADAIKKMSSMPAKKMRIESRGSLRVGNYADIVVFDPRLMRDRAKYRNPFRYSVGVESVIVNGKIAVEKGGVTGVRAGNILKSN